MNPTEFHNFIAKILEFNGFCHLFGYLYSSKYEDFKNCHQTFSSIMIIFYQARMFISSYYTLMAMTITY